jgi:hypothetical protein
MKELFVTSGERHVKRIEGDVWEERGKMWTIKNGIKKTVTKMDEARREFLTPLACPKCGEAMKAQADAKIWSINKTCLNCLVEAEHKIRKAGKWEEYEKAKILANATGFVKDLESFFKEFAAESVTKAHVTEDGVIEKWKDDGLVAEIGKDVVKNINEKITNYKNQTKE